MRRPAVVRSALVGLLVVLAPVVGLAPAVPASGEDVGTSPAPVVGRLVVIDHNVERRSGAVAAAVREARSSGASLIALQEVCWWQVRDLAEAHPTWTMSWRQDDTTWRCRSQAGTDPVTNRGRKGSGLLAIRTGPATPSGRRFRAQPHGLDQGMACLSWNERGVRARFCSVHLARQKVQRKQARELRRVTGAWVRRGDLVVVAGDLNATPNSRTLDELYELDGRGRFQEATTCQSGVLVCRRRGLPTYDGLRAKIDYVFISRNRMVEERWHGIQVRPTYSDHHLLRATASVNLD